MPSNTFQPRGNGIINAGLLYLFAFAYPVAVGLVVSGYKVPWTAQGFSMFLTVCSISCLIGQRLVPEFATFWQVFGKSEEEECKDDDEE
ncbi:MAG: hypothetical protein ACIAQ0_09110 [Phycisphaerales bacterium JB058]